MTMDPDAVHRTAKVLVDSGEAASIEEAERELSRYVLQIDVGPDSDQSWTHQAILLTAVNAGARAFLGGVRVRLSGDSTLGSGWDAGRPLSQAVQRLGGTIIHDLEDHVPTICVGEPSRRIRGSPILRATFDGWAAGVMEGPSTSMPERGRFVPAGVAAGAIAVAEAFQSRRGDPRAGRRQQGISLWRPEIGWQLPGACGSDDIDIAPSRVWVIGLGHLGQAYLWTLGLLPYADLTAVTLMLQDDDRITKANESTGLLTPLVEWRGRRKARALGEFLDSRGFVTAITERRFQPGHWPHGDEPRLALVGVDNPETRMSLSDAGFEVVIDAGLGGGPDHYLDLQLHAFPASRRSGDVPGWRDRVQTGGDALLDLPAYRTMLEESGDRCGTVEVAGRTVAAAFVGATAGALVISEAIRYLAGEHRYSVVDATLRDLAALQAVEATDPPFAGNPGFARLRTQR
jgi:hypothetical protein